MDIFSIFVTGLFAGGLTCLAVQGGLLASSIAQSTTGKITGNKQHKYDEQIKYGNIIPALSFLITRLIAYTILGLFLGALGSVAQLTLSTRVVLQFVVAIFMVGTALNLLQVHPIFRYFVIQPPKFLSRMVRNQAKSRTIFGPALLGFFTVLIPCGATQAMMAYAVSTGSPVTGAVTMFVFILGTSPLFFLLGYLAKKLGKAQNTGFNKIAAVAIILVAMFNVNSALALSGSSFTLENIYSNVTCTLAVCDEPSVGTAADTVSEATVYLTSFGYKLNPKNINVKAGSQVKLKLINQDGAGCIQAFTIPKLGIQRTIPVGSSDEITFKAPEEKGKLPFMCGMGMYRDVINVL